jgi:hypothetical protein
MALAGFETATFGSSGKHTNHYTTKATFQYSSILTYHRPVICATDLIKLPLFVATSVSKLSVIFLTRHMAGLRVIAVIHFILQADEFRQTVIYCLLIQ